MGMKVPDDFVSVCSGIFDGFKLFFRIHGKVFSAGIYVCEEIDFCDSDLLIFSGSCKESA